MVFLSNSFFNLRSGNSVIDSVHRSYILGLVDQAIVVARWIVMVAAAWISSKRQQEVWKKEPRKAVMSSVVIISRLFSTVCVENVCRTVRCYFLLLFVTDYCTENEGQK
jgi:hypothetical protein